jgi:hypothetical protein
MFPCTKRSLTRSKEVPLSCPTSLPESLPGQVTPYPISYPDVYLDSYLRLCPIRAWSFSRVLPGHVPNRVNLALSERLPSQVKSYPIMDRALPEAHVPGLTRGLPGRVTFTRLCTRSYPIFLPDRVTSC